MRSTLERPTGDDAGRADDRQPRRATALQRVRDRIVAARSVRRVDVVRVVDTERARQDRRRRDDRRDVQHRHGRRGLIAVGFVGSLAALDRHVEHPPTIDAGPCVRVLVRIERTVVVEVPLVTRARHAVGGEHDRAALVDLVRTTGGHVDRDDQRKDLVTNRAVGVGHAHVHLIGAWDVRQPRDDASRVDLHAGRRRDQRPGQRIVTGVGRHRGVPVVRVDHALGHRRAADDRRHVVHGHRHVGGRAVVARRATAQRHRARVVRTVARREDRIGRRHFEQAVAVEVPGQRRDVTRGACTDERDVAAFVDHVRATGVDANNRDLPVLNRRTAVFIGRAHPHRMHTGDRCSPTNAPGVPVDRHASWVDIENERHRRVAVGRRIGDLRLVVIDHADLADAGRCRRELRRTVVDRDVDRRDRAVVQAVAVARTNANRRRARAVGAEEVRLLAVELEPSAAVGRVAVEVPVEARASDAARVQSNRQALADLVTTACFVCVDADDDDREVLRRRIRAVGDRKADCMASCDDLSGGPRDATIRRNGHSRRRRRQRPNQSLRTRVGRRRRVIVQRVQHADRDRCRGDDRRDVTNRDVRRRRVAVRRVRLIADSQDNRTVRRAVNRACIERRVARVRLERAVAVEVPAERRREVAACVATAGEGDRAALVDRVRAARRCGDHDDVEALRRGIITVGDADLDLMHAGDGRRPAHHTTVAHAQAGRTGHATPGQDVVDARVRRRSGVAVRLTEVRRRDRVAGDGRRDVVDRHVARGDRDVRGARASGPHVRGSQVARRVARAVGGRDGRPDGALGVVVDPHPQAEARVEVERAEVVARDAQLGGSVHRVTRVVEPRAHVLATGPATAAVVRRVEDLVPVVEDDRVLGTTRTVERRATELATAAVVARLRILIERHEHLVVGEDDALPDHVHVVVVVGQVVLDAVALADLEDRQVPIREVAVDRDSRARLRACSRRDRRDRVAVDRVERHAWAFGFERAVVVEIPLDARAAVGRRGEIPRGTLVDRERTTKRNRDLHVDAERLIGGAAVLVIHADRHVERATGSRRPADTTRLRVDLHARRLSSDEGPAKLVRVRRIVRVGVVRIRHRHLRREDRRGRDDRRHVVHLYGRRSDRAVGLVGAITRADTHGRRRVAVTRGEGRGRVVHIPRAVVVDVPLETRACNTTCSQGQGAALVDHIGRAGRVRVHANHRDGEGLLVVRTFVVDRAHLDQVATRDDLVSGPGDHTAGPVDRHAVRHRTVEAIGDRIDRVGRVDVVGVRRADARDENRRRGDRRRHVLDVDRRGARRTVLAVVAFADPQRDRAADRAVNRGCNKRRRRTGRVVELRVAVEVPAILVAVAAVTARAQVDRAAFGNGVRPTRVGGDVDDDRPALGRLAAVIVGHLDLDGVAPTLCRRTAQPRDRRAEVQPGGARLAGPRERIQWARVVFADRVVEVVATDRDARWRARRDARVGVANVDRRGAGVTRRAAATLHANLHRGHAVEAAILRNLACRVIEGAVVVEVPSPRGARVAAARAGDLNRRAFVDRVRAAAGDVDTNVDGEGAITHATLLVVGANDDRVQTGVERTRRPGHDTAGRVDAQAAATLHEAPTDAGHVARHVLRHRRVAPRVAHRGVLTGDGVDRRRDVLVVDNPAVVVADRAYTRAHHDRTRTRSVGRREVRREAARLEHAVVVHVPRRAGAAHAGRRIRRRRQRSRRALVHRVQATDVRVHRRRVHAPRNLACAQGAVANRQAEVAAVVLEAHREVAAAVRVAVEATDRRVIRRQVQRDLEGRSRARRQRGRRHVGPLHDELVPDRLVVDFRAGSVRAQVGPPAGDHAVDTRRAGHARRRTTVVRRRLEGKETVRRNVHSRVALAVEPERLRQGNLRVAVVAEADGGARRADVRP